MGEKQDLIKQMLEMQQQFIQYEQEHGVSADVYYTPDTNHPLYNYRDKYAELANKVLDLAHSEKNSKR